MARDVWDRLLAAVKSMHEADDTLTAFCPFPKDIVAQDVEAFHIPAADLMQADAGFPDPVCQAFIDATPLAKWRETYKGTDIGQDFMDRFACYCLIGEGGAFQSETMAAWVVYMPPHLHYPWHHHPAERCTGCWADPRGFSATGWRANGYRPATAVNMLQINPMRWKPKTARSWPM